MYIDFIWNPLIFSLVNRFDQKSFRLRYSWKITKNWVSYYSRFILCRHNHVYSISCLLNTQSHGQLFHMYWFYMCRFICWCANIKQQHYSVSVSVLIWIFSCSLFNIVFYREGFDNSRTTLHWNICGKFVEIWVCLDNT